MSFTRFNYDDCRTQKILEESTGPGTIHAEQARLGE